MKTKMGARSHARIAMILAASGISLTVVGVLAACTTAPSAGSLADTSERGDVAGAAESVTPMNSGSPQASPTGAVSESGSGPESFYGAPHEISAERRGVIAAAVRSFTATLPDTQLISTDVMNEAARSSAAVATVLREGRRQYLAVSVRKDGDSWEVVNVDTLPSIQGSR